MAKKKAKQNNGNKPTTFKRNIAKNPINWEAMFAPEYAGWIPPEDRATEEQKKQEQYIFDTPTVREVFSGNIKGDYTRPRMWEIVKKGIDKGYIPQEVLRNGTLKNVSQIIGSCVGFGAGNMLLWASLIDAVLRRHPERVLLPFVPYHYGRGRYHSGISGHGSGSLGSGQAEALEKDGYIAFDLKGLPDCNFGDAIHWTERIEYEWSNGAKIDDKWIEEGRKHVVPTVVRVTNTDEAALLADSLHTFTIASDWGGHMKCPIKQGVLLNERIKTWMHQMWVLDYIIHPRLGRLWWVGNNWKYAHGKDPGGEWDNNTGAPEGGFYIIDKELQYILSQKDSYGFADPKGVIDPSREIDWSMFDFLLAG